MIKPLPNYVLIEPIEDEGKSIGGVYLPESAKDKPSKGKVVDVGFLYERSDGQVRPSKSFILNNYSDFLIDNPPVKKGQIVIYKKWTNQEVQNEGKEYLLVRFDELLAVIE